jgi:hypothetical protein
MGYVKKRINELSKEHGGKRKASRFCENWFTSALKDRAIKEAQVTRDRFQPGKIYVFKYTKPKYIENLPWFDENPVVLAIEQVGDNDFGVNLNLLPIPVKEKLLDDLYIRLGGVMEGTAKEKSNPLTEKQLKISYKGMKSYLEKFGCEFALRQYIPEKKKNQAVVSYSKWPEIALCDFMELKGTNMMQIRVMYKDYLKKNI